MCFQTVWVNCKLRFDPFSIYQTHNCARLSEMGTAFTTAQTTRKRPQSKVHIIVSGSNIKKRAQPKGWHGNDDEDDCNDINQRPRPTSVSALHL